MGEADAGSWLEHENVDEVLKIAVVHRLGVAHTGEVLEERIAAAFLPGELKVIVVMQHGAFVIVSLGAKLHPKALVFAPASGEVEALVGGTVDVTGPEATEPAALMHVLMRCAPKLHVKIPRSTQSKTCGALHVKGGRGWLMQLGLLVIELFECHWRAAGLKENIAPLKLRLAVEDMLKIQPGVGGHKDTACTVLVLKIPDAIVARSMALGGLMTCIVTDEGDDFTEQGVPRTG